MFYKILNNFLNKSDLIRQFNKFVEIEEPKQIVDLNDSAKSLLLAHLFQTKKKNIVFVTGNDTIAQNTCDDLEILLDKTKIFHLNSYEILPYEEFSPRRTCQLERSNALSAAVIQQPGIYIVSLREFLRKINLPELYKKNTTHLKIGKEYAMDVLLDDLISCGYTRTSQVSQAGDISKRGGILDVFSPQYKNPFRIEFFGDEIESIREFSAKSQRSINTEKSNLTIQPIRELSLKQISEHADDYFIQKIAETGFYEGMEQDFSQLIEKTTTFSEYFFAQKTTMIFDEAQHIQEIEDDLFDEAEEQREKYNGERNTNCIPEPEQLFSHFSDLKLESFKSVYFNNKNNHITTKSISFPVRSQMNFNSNISLLVDEIKALSLKDFTIFIQSDTKSQSKRIMNTLADLGDNLRFQVGVFHNGFILDDAKIAIFTDHEIFNRYKRKRRITRFSKAEAIADYETLKNGDYVVHIDYGIGICNGLQTITVGNTEMDCIVVYYAGGDKVYVPTDQLNLLSKFSAKEGIEPQIHTLGGARWDNTKKRIRKDVENIAKDLVRLYAKRKMAKGFAFSGDTEWQRDMEASFIYQDTEDQIKSTEDVKNDMESPLPMERLICGDVGFGKTEVAIRAAFKAVMDSKQVAFVVPTTILAEQHYITFSERLKDYPIRIEMLSRFVTKKKQNQTVESLRFGEIDIVIGTHRLFSKDIHFKDLGLLILDEEHRFGVRHKEKLKQLRENVDTLNLTATPIPRTLNMALSGVKDMTLMRIPPENRLPIRTTMMKFDKKIIKSAIRREIDRQGQVFFLHNRVQSIYSMQERLEKMLPEVNFCVGHGQMSERELESVMMNFYHHNFDVLICTTIIESGIDIPNANTIIMNRADKLGLAQLYQLRGRVGRSDHQAYAYLVIPKKVNKTAHDRLKTLERYEALGSGLHIAMQDLEIRGAGNLLGAKQHGLMNQIGINFYNQILKRAVEKIQKGEEADIFEIDKKRTKVQTEIPYYLPDYYIEDEKIRLQFYRKLNLIENQIEFMQIKEEMIDRFGELPQAAKSVFWFYEIAFIAEKNAINSIVVGKNIIRIHHKRNIARDRILAILKQTEYKIDFKQTKGLQINIHIKHRKGREVSGNFSACLRVLGILF
ncbi:MAG: transcription-repair coupling factor [Candidatus Cloacimonadota bacterium]|nr:transcription-repair coupling factor [Candidatus Cloacimonadota bacterium]